MRSREISLKSNMWHFQFSTWLKCSLRYILLKTPPDWTSGSKVVGKWRILWTQNKRNSLLFLAVSHDHNQYSWLPTDSARLQHKINILNLAWCTVVVCCLQFCAQAAAMGIKIIHFTMIRINYLHASLIYRFSCFFKVTFYYLNTKYL